MEIFSYPRLKDSFSLGFSKEVGLELRKENARKRGGRGVGDARRGVGEGFATQGREGSLLLTPK